MFEKKERFRTSTLAPQAAKRVALKQKKVISEEKKNISSKKSFKILIKLNFSHSFHFGSIGVSSDPLKLSIGRCMRGYKIHWEISRIYVRKNSRTEKWRGRKIKYCEKSSQKNCESLKKRKIIHKKLRVKVSRISSVSNWDSLNSWCFGSARERR